MTYDLIEQAEHSIHHVHELILRVFTDADGAGAASIEPLMQAFAEDFSMVGISGDALTRVEVEQLFKGAVGAKAGLDIEISDLHTVWQEDDMLAVSYVETQRLDGAQHSRVAVAILSGQPEGVKWVYLHETPLSRQV
ncbi:hypothetical protein J2Y39_002695 [Pseudomonas sp. 2957]|jgi:hypothetical protein|uniref:DUF4440 domain-containing protein n=1 Tax=Pseudomonas fluorescens TaxID=294 RepID=A0A5E7PAC2_PSEFL|nr:MULTISPECIES: hypothetical protein [Pseudomonas]KQT63043.1 hypothetical protein ASG55_20700 [Pseudomonas sp. Leaf434]MDR6948090.1 hypothetical protein [Pseudomonas sp. 2957]UST94429.1 DUF4440 domain-containing protein [Pseudomonas siliginis]UST99601.1 DUF4440 domain-containing protein [Pseudomonas siliginis]VVP45870.1 hypothetical protein PS847_05093 [Pseudomonas fluorescens]